MIHINTVRKIINSGEPFSCRVWESSTGEILNYNDVVCTSSNFRNNTFNIKILSSEQIRKVKMICVFEINNEEIYI